MKSSWKFVAAAGIAVVFMSGLNLAQDGAAKTHATASARPEDENAIKEASMGLARALEKGDAKAVAAFWTEEGEYASEDHEAIRGRNAIEAAYAKFFSTRPTVKVEGSCDSIRFLGKDTAIEEGSITVTAKDAASHTSKFSAVFARQDGKWQIGMLKEWPEEESKRASLKDFEWIIGEWESTVGEAKARTKYTWAVNNVFIRCEYSVSLGSDPSKTSTGVQVIGVDPAYGYIRSWTFDSEGGIGEATWTYDGEKWAIDSEATLSDGTETTALNFLTRKDKDSFSWRSVRRTLDGKNQPDIPAVIVKRVGSAK